MSPQWGLVLNLDNIVLNNYWRKYYTYLEIGWDEASIHSYLSKKEFIMQIASFNTVTVTFSASSRRNRFYDIYNRLDMLDKDVPWGDSVEGLKKLSEMYRIFIVTSRTEELKEKTLEVMRRLGFPMEKLTILFKKNNENLHQYRIQCLQDIVKQYTAGVGICLNPTDIQLFERFAYTPIALTSLKEYIEFEGKVPAICNDWDHILISLNCK